MTTELIRFGIPSSIIRCPVPAKVTGKTELLVSCSCGAQATLQVASIVRTIKRVGHYRCIACGMREKHKDPAYRAKHSAGVRSSWTQERLRKQSEISKGLWEDDSFRASVSSKSTEAWSDPDRRAAASEFISVKWDDPEYRRHCEEARSTPEAVDASRQRARDMWSDPEYQEKQARAKSSDGHRQLQSDLARARWANPEYRSAVTDSVLELWDDPALREEMSDRVLSLWKDPEYLAKQARVSVDPDLCRLKSENAKRQWQNPETREKIVRSLANILKDGKDSILERVTQTILGALDVPFIRHHVIGYWEFDLFIPSHNILVECNGEYWHSLRKSQDSSKFTYIDEYFPQYKILYLWERDFLNPGLIQQKLSKAMALEDDSPVIRDFDFSDVSIRKMDLTVKVQKSFYSVAEEFLQSYHYAGFGRSARAVYGAFLGEELVGVCKFAPPVRAEAATSMGLTQSQVLELDRFCIHPLYHKKNFASWMLARCQRLAFSDFPAASTLISFADSTFGHFGTIYKAANWTKLHDVRPDYHYLSPDGFVVHKKTLYDHASRNSRSESDYAESFGYVKVFGKSKVKFCFYRPK